MYQLFCHAHLKPIRSKQNAHQLAKRKRLRAYLCLACKGWHVTSKEVKLKRRF